MPKFHSRVEHVLSQCIEYEMAITKSLYSVFLSTNMMLVFNTMIEMYFLSQGLCIQTVKWLFLDQCQDELPFIKSFYKNCIS